MTNITRYYNLRAHTPLQAISVQMPTEAGVSLNSLSLSLSLPLAVCLHVYVYAAFGALCH